MYGATPIGIYPGQYYEQETGFHYNYYRYYDPKTGRYLTPDPIGQAGGLNLYLYVRGNPVGKIDPFGLADLVLFAPTARQYKGALAAPSPPNTITVAGHGTPTQMLDELEIRLTAAEVADQIRLRTNYRRGMTIQLMSCNTGVYPGPELNQFAQELANELCENILAPDNFFWFYDDGRTEIAPTNMRGITWRNFSREAEACGPDLRRRGEYRLFSPMRFPIWGW